MKQALILLINSIGMWGIFMVIVLEYACFPIPSEIVLPLAGYYASLRSIGFPVTLVMSILAGLTGSSILYACGYYGGRAVLDHIGGKYKGTQKSIHAAKTWFDRYGARSVLVGRVIPLARTYISLVAGTARMRFDRFFVFSLLGISLWNFVLVGLGYYLGSNWGRVDLFYGRLKIILLSLAVALGLFLICRHLGKYNYKA